MGFDPEKITFFAKTDARGKQVPFGIKAKDRQRHMYVVGKTGMGKSTMLENMAAQDIQNGEGMAFIDPHGSAAETLLDYVPEHRINDVIYFAPFDLSNPISFNVMEDVGPDKRHLVVSGLMSTFKKIWVDAWSARMEYILTNALLALIEYPDTTLLSVNRLFSDKVYRTRVVDYIKDPAVKAFWTEEFANYTDRFAAEALPAIQNKIGQFTGNPLIRNIIGQPHSSFDIRKIMDEKKILIMNLSKGLVGETNANLLGSMLTTRIYLAAMSRADLPVEQMRSMPNFYFYVDEFQSFANATFANILSEARKYHLNLIIAHQYIEQMEEDVRNAVFGNVGTTIAFRVGPFDAELLETVFSPRFLATDLVNLGFAQIYLTLMIDGIGSPPFSAVTLPPIEHPHLSCKGMVIAASRKNYTKSRAEVEKIVTDLHVPVKKEEAIPRKFNNSNDPSKLKEVKPAVEVKETKPSVAREETPRRREEDRNVKPTVGNKDFQTKRAPIVSHERPHNTVTNNYPKTPPQAQRTTDELRSVLAKISESQQVKKADESSENTLKEVAKNISAKGEEGKPSVLRSALAEVLKKVESPAREEIINQKVVLEDKPRSDYQEPILTSVPTPVETTLSPTPVEENTSFVEKRVDNSRAELERLAAEAEEAFNTLEQDGSRANPQNNPLDAKKIERLFKTSGNERSPFSS